MSSTGRPSILVVDDKENMLKLFSRILGDAYEVTTRGTASGRCRWWPHASSTWWSRTSRCPERTASRYCAR